MNIKKGGLILTTLILAFTSTFCFAQSISQLDKYNVEWDTPGPTSTQSMPLGNGDIGLNVWFEKNGDLVFY
ncbi:MAG: hypothetical protein JWQ57_1570, partial [Mucilaginibacter sp.]|nr:hypothetical protein [Mucilaginibacter sp.]